MTADFFRPGDYNVQCDQCDRKVKASDTRTQWDNLRVCAECYDPRHSQDIVRGRRDRQSVPDPRPDSTIFVDD